MRPVEPACSWFRHLAYLGRDPEDTLRHYAYIVLRLMEFLAERGRDLGTARRGPSSRSPPSSVPERIPISLASGSRRAEHSSLEEGPR